MDRLHQLQKTVDKFVSDSAPFGNVKKIRSDNGGEYVAEFNKVVVTQHIQHNTSSPYAPHQNGTAERTWRTLFDMARALMINSKIPMHLWTYAIMAAAHIRNGVYHQRIKDTPYRCRAH